MGSSCIDEYDGWRLHFHGGFPQCGADRRGGVLADDCGKKFSILIKAGCVCIPNGIYMLLYLFLHA